MSIDSLKAQLLESKKHVVDLKQKQTELTSRLVDCREGLPVLRMKIEVARKQRAKVSDAVILNEASMDDLELCDATLDEAEESYSKSQEVFDVLTREIKTLETGIPAAISESESLKRQLWEAISAEFEAKITTGIKDAVRTIISIGCQTGRPRQLILDSLFPNPSDGEVQEIQKQLRQKHEID